MGNSTRAKVSFRSFSLVFKEAFLSSDLLVCLFDFSFENRLRENAWQTQFDSNAISPGTNFMVHFETALMEYLSNKAKHHSNWQDCEIYVSGSNVCVSVFSSILNIFIHLIGF